MKKKLSEKTKKIIIAAASMAIGVATIVIGNIIASAYYAYDSIYATFGGDFYTYIYRAVDRVVVNTEHTLYLISDISRLAFIVTGCGFILHGVKILFLIGSAQQGSDQCIRKKGGIDLDRLEKLKAAYDNGILNESEYYTERSKILNG